MTSAILTCDIASNRCWQLGDLPPSHGNVVLIGWKEYPASVEGGVPRQVAKILSAAITEVACATFPCSVANHEATSAWTALNDNMVRSLGSGSPFARIKATFMHTPTNVLIMATRQASTAERLFDDFVYPWTLQGQVVLLTEHEGNLPDIDRKTLLSLFNDDWTQYQAILADFGVLGVLRPGVDGAIAGLWSLSNAFEKRFLKSLRQVTEQTGFEWMPRTENEFKDCLATP